VGLGGQRHAPAALLSGKTRYPLYRMVGGPQGRSGRVRKILPPPGFDPRTVQPVASRYTDWAIPAHKYWKGFQQNLQNRVLYQADIFEVYKLNWWAYSLFFSDKLYVSVVEADSKINIFYLFQHDINKFSVNYL
jgi:hypothetical protein